MRATPSLRPGDAAPPRAIGPVTITDIVRFAGAGGDFNPLHHDEAAARAAGFPSVIAMGQFAAGLVAGLLTDWIGIENIEELSVRFVAPISVGELLEVTGLVELVDDTGARVELAVRSGESVKVTARALVRQDPTR